MPETKQLHGQIKLDSYVPSLSLSKIQDAYQYTKEPEMLGDTETCFSLFNNLAPELI